MIVDGFKTEIVNDILEAHKGKTVSVEELLGIIWNEEALEQLAHFVASDSEKRLLDKIRKYHVDDDEANGPRKPEDYPEDHAKWKNWKWLGTSDEPNEIHVAYDAATEQPSEDVGWIRDGEYNGHWGDTGVSLDECDGAYSLDEPAAECAEDGSADGMANEGFGWSLDVLNDGERSWIVSVVEYPDGEQSVTKLIDFCNRVTAKRALNQMREKFLSDEPLSTMENSPGPKKRKVRLSVVEGAGEGKGTGWWITAWEYDPKDGIKDEPLMSYKTKEDAEEALLKALDKSISE